MFNTEDPKITADSLDELIPLLERRDLVSFPVRSAFMISLIDEIAAKGMFPYNEDIKILFRQRTGLDGEGLRFLVYWAQKFRDLDIKIKAGFVPLTPELIQEAVRRGKKIELLGESIIGESKSLCTPKVLDDGRAVLFAPRSRTKGYRPEGQPAKIV